MGDAIMLHRVKQRYPKYTYVVDGVDRTNDTNYILWVDDGSGNWRIKFLKSGNSSAIFTFTSLGNARKGIDVFLVGGGGGGAWYTYTNSWTMKAGGGSGYTKTVKGVSVVKGTGYGITIGAGGAAGGSSGASGGYGGNTMAFGQTAYGGNRSRSGTASDTYRARAYHHYVPDAYDDFYAWGGHGGSGGSAVNDSGLTAQATNGANGSTRYLNGYGAGGTGQGTTTREFGESGGTLYANGGGSGSHVIDNTGNGGNYNGAGSSGIVVIRNHRG